MDREYFFTSKSFIGLFMLFLGLAIGITGTFQFMPKTEKIVYKEKPIAVIESKYETVTTGMYTKKEKPTDADIEVKQSQPVVNVKVNEKDYQFKLDQYESQKFDKGKFVLTQGGTISIDVKTPKDTKEWGLGVGYGTNGFGLMLEKRMGNTVSGWGYFDSKTAIVGAKINF